MRIPESELQARPHLPNQLRSSFDGLISLIFKIFKDGKKNIFQLFGQE